MSSRTLRLLQKAKEMDTIEVQADKTPSSEENNGNNDEGTEGIIENLAEKENIKFFVVPEYLEMSLYKPQADTVEVLKEAFSNNTRSWGERSDESQATQQTKTYLKGPYGALTMGEDIFMDASSKNTTLQLSPSQEQSGLLIESSESGRILRKKGKPLVLDEDSFDDDIADPDFNPESERNLKELPFFSEADLMTDVNLNSTEGTVEFLADGISHTDKTKSPEIQEDTEPKKKRFRTLDSQMENNRAKRPFQINRPCKCKKQCFDKISLEIRQKIHERFWSIDRHHQRTWLSTKIVEKESKRRLQNSRRKYTRYFYLPGSTDENKMELIEVCQKMFLSTLGFTSDTVLKTILKACKDKEGNTLVVPVQNKRGIHPNPYKKDRTLVRSHILSFKPRHAHYKRYHAPNRRYLPSDLTIKAMHEDFGIKYPDQKVLYETYRQVVNEMNIGFTQDAPEKCGTCMEFDMNPTPENCLLKDMHLLKVNLSRQNYNSDKEQDSDTKVFAADMQKIILLPRMPDLIDSFFLSRLIVFNETFASLKKKDNHILILWHEAIAGRKVEEVTCSFVKFFLSNRDSRIIIIWMDNCAAQNKNWCLYSSVLHYLNSGLSNTEEIHFKYLVKGHTFMAADGIHGKIEQMMRKKKNIHDFEDFKSTCETASKRSRITTMQVQDFMELKTDIRTRKPKDKQDTLPYLKDIVEVKFSKGSSDFCYRTGFDKEFVTTENILKRKTELGTFPDRRSEPRGIPTAKKEAIIKELVPKMPQSRQVFWQSIPENTSSSDLIEEGY